MAQKTGMDRSAGDPDVWIGLDHLRFGMDHGVWIACGTGVWIGTLHFEPQPYSECFIYLSLCLSTSLSTYPSNFIDLGRRTTCQCHSEMSDTGAQLAQKNIGGWPKTSEENTSLFFLFYDCHVFSRHMCFLRRSIYFVDLPVKNIDCS